MEKDVTLYRDLDLGFRMHPLRKDLIPLTNVDAVSRSIRHAVNFARLEKPFDPTHYSAVHSYLFDPVSKLNASFLIKAIETTIYKMEPRVKDLDVKVEPNQREDGYNITIKFTVKSLNQDGEVNVFFQRVR